MYKYKEMYFLDCLVADRDRGSTFGTIEAFYGHNLEVQCTQIHAKVPPGGEMIFNSDSTTFSWGLSLRDELVKGGSTLNRRFVDSCAFKNAVDGSVTRESALCCAEVCIGVIFDDIVLDEWTCRPAVN